MTKHFFTLIIILIIQNSSAFAFTEYNDKTGSKINFLNIPKSHDFSSQHLLFIKTFNDEYANIKPENIQPYFKTKNDVTEWLSNIFTIENKYFISATHPVNWIAVEKNNTIIGFILYEQWKNDINTWHIRLIAILPSEQRKGYGAALIKSIHNLHKNIEKIILDTRRTNSKAIAFYKKNSFKIIETPHNIELNKNLYLGLYKDK